VHAFLFLQCSLNTVAFCTLCLLKQNGSSYFGALVGRVANRVAKGRFVLDGKAYHLYINDGKNAMHGELSFSTRSVAVCMEHGVLPLMDRCR
jgi:galactose mutarotase-like enzyme